MSWKKQHVQRYIQNNGNKLDSVLRLVQLGMHDSALSLCKELAIILYV